jgi:hypothetical protein
MTIPFPSSASELREHRQQKEREAFQAYAAALRKWERARDRVDDAAWELQLTSAELQQKTLGGATSAEAAALRRACRDLQEMQRRAQNEAAKAKEHASATFTALVAARNARLQLEEALEEIPASELASRVVVLNGHNLPDCPHVRWN